MLKHENMKLLFILFFFCPVKIKIFPYPITFSILKASFKNSLLLICCTPDVVFCFPVWIALLIFLSLSVPLFLFACLSVGLSLSLSLSLCLSVCLSLSLSLSLSLYLSIYPSISLSLFHSHFNIQTKSFA